MEQDHTEQNLEENTQNQHLPVAFTVDPDWIEKVQATLRVREYVLSQAFGEVRVEQERTRKAKEKFLDIYSQTIGTITVACDQANISRDVFYLWMKNDPHFRSMVSAIKDQRVSMVEDRLMKLILMDDGPSIRFFLERIAPEYKNKGEIEVVTGTRTFEDLLYEKARKDRVIHEGKVIDVVEEGPKQIHE